jgi:hypothetical protein
MTAMVQTIEAQLKQIQGLGTASPTIRCSTCYQGHTKPPTDLPQR